jgi:hypothetical protein
MDRYAKNYNQEHILNYKVPDFKESDLETFTLKINSKDRNIIREPNPFSFEITFDQYTNLNHGAVIAHEFERIKKITLSQMCIPRFIPRNYIGEPVTGITPVYNNDNSISLSYYPGININNTVINFYDISNNQLKIEVLELVDLFNKKLYLVALQYNNPYFTSSYINIKAELFSYLNINNIIYPINNITGNIIKLDNTANYPLPICTNNRLIIADYYKNCLMIDTNGSKIGITNLYIQITQGNILNFQYLFKGQYLEYQINNSISNFVLQKVLFSVNYITTKLINNELPDIISNTNILIYGNWVQGTPYNFILSDNIFYDTINTIRLNQFNYGVRDLFDEKAFYLNLYPYVPTCEVATDSTFNNSFGVLYPFTPNSMKDYLYLRGDATETYTNVNLQTTRNKIRFSLMDSNNQLIGTVYNDFFNFYSPNNNISINSYLPFQPDLTIILKFEEINKKFTNIG